VGYAKALILEDTRQISHQTNATKKTLTPMMPSKLLFQRTLMVLSLLLIPLVAMQFTDQVDWSFGDFLVMAGLLFSLTMAVAVVRQKVREKTQRIGLIALLLLIFLLIWAELAVGIFGTFLAGS
jgi:uncharacterized membrane protein